MKSVMTNAEYAVLGLLVEKPGHGYDLERVIKERGMRNWTELAFSSIYYVLKKLEDRGFVVSSAESGSSQKARKTFSATKTGKEQHRQKTLQALADPHPVFPSILLGLANWPSVDRDAAIDALLARRSKLQAQIAEIASTAGSQSPLPDFVEVLFDYSVSQLQAEIDWLEKAVRTLGGDNAKD